VRYTHNKNFFISVVYFVSPANSGTVSPLRHYIIHPNSLSSYHDAIVWGNKIILEATQEITICFKIQTCIRDMPDSNLDRDIDYPVFRSHPQSVQTNGRIITRLGQQNASHIPSRAVKLTAVSRRPLTAEVRIQSQARSQGICGGQSGTVTGFLPVLRFPLSVPFHQHSIFMFTCE